MKIYENEMILHTDLRKRGVRCSSTALQPFWSLQLSFRIEKRIEKTWPRRHAVVPRHAGLGIVFSPCCLHGGRKIGIAGATRLIYADGD